MRNSKFIFKKEHLEIPTLKYDVYVVITNDFFKASQKLNHNEHDKEWYDEASAVALHSLHEGQSFVLFKPNASVEQIAHEMWHVVRRMLEWVGAGLENEIVAYHLGYLAGHAYDILKHKRRT